MGAVRVGLERREEMRGDDGERCRLAVGLGQARSIRRGEAPGIRDGGQGGSGRYAYGSGRQKLQARGREMRKVGM